MELLKEWFELMEYEVELISKDEIMVTDYGWIEEGEIVIKTIKEWCKYFIEIMEYKIKQDEGNNEMVELFTKDIKELKMLGNLN
ncbi:MAG: hypothetical protein IJH34_12810 [Romboutsia sp.]|nr:hypothetical protein [Romboutsia sp.]